MGCGEWVVFHVCRECVVCCERRVFRVFYFNVASLPSPEDEGRGLLIFRQLTECVGPDLLLFRQLTEG